MQATDNSGDRANQRFAPTARPHIAKSLLAWSIVNLAGLGLLWLLENFTPEVFWPATLLTFTPQVLFLLPTLVLAILCWRRKRWRLLGVQLAVVLWWVIGFSNWNWPRAAAPVPASAIRVMTYNIRIGSLGIEKVLATVHEQNPEILFVQEALQKAHFSDPMPTLRSGLPGYHEARYGELVVFSKFPVTYHRRHALRAHNGSGILEARLLVRGKPFTVFCAHFTNPIDGRIWNWPREISTRAAIRSTQFRLLRRLARRCKTPFLIAGDFNTGSRGSLYRRLSGQFTDNALSSGWDARATFPARFPIERIDYFWTKRDVRVLNCRVVNSTASDHRPLMGLLEIPAVERGENSD